MENGFSYLTDNRIIVDLAYFGNDNFVGCQIPGYEANVCILTNEAIRAIIKVQSDLEAINKGYRLKIFDAYRPNRASLFFKSWSNGDIDTDFEHENSIDLSFQKNKFYPEIDRKILFDKGYLVVPSSHSRGSTVDLTICDYCENTHGYNELDMGTIFDFFGERSATSSNLITKLQAKNRTLLVDVMAKNGFINYSAEWWHFTLENEPFDGKVFDFVIK